MRKIIALIGLGCLAACGTQNMNEDVKVSRAISLEMEDSPYQLFFESERFLADKEQERVEVEGVHFFGESLHVKLAEGSPVQYSFQNKKGVVVAEGLYDSPNNGGISLATLPVGRYFLYLDGCGATVEPGLSERWYTVTRKGFAHKIQLSRSYHGRLAVEVEAVKKLPKQVYDILIDPGHGGMDTGTSGNGLIESEEVLTLSLYMASRFEDHGLKVKLSRDGDYESAGAGNYHHIESPYYDNGRVEQAYRHQAKYLISNHLNAVGGGILVEGYEVYTSILTDDKWSSTVSKALCSTGRTVRDSLQNEYRVSKGSFKKWSQDAPDKDYLYILRESGGVLSKSTSLVKYNPAYEEVPLHGAEAMLVEYAYIDNPAEAQLWNQHAEAWAEAVIKGTLEYLGITYKER